MNIEFEQACQILETAFSPLACHCERGEDGLFRLVIYENDPAAPSLIVCGIAPERLQSIRAVSQLALEVRQHLTVETMRRRLGQPAGSGPSTDALTIISPQLTDAVSS